MKTPFVTGMTVCAAALLTLSTGCSAFRASIDDADPISSSSLTAHFDQRDLETWAQAAAQTLLSQNPKILDGSPIFVELGIRNGTSDHIDMNMMGNALRVQMMQSGKVRFVNAAARDKLLSEQGYQLANCTPDTKANIGKQLGAGYMVTGYLGQIDQRSPKQVRVSKQEDVYYQLTVDVTNLESGLVEATAQEERMRRANKPLIGW